MPLDGLEALSTMTPIAPRLGSDRLRVLCLGAHSDDIEIGCGGALLRWLRDYGRVEVCWAVFGAQGERAEEARRSADALLERAEHRVVLGDLPDSRMHGEFTRAKDFAIGLRDSFSPDVVLTHRLEDRHQDHRLVAELTWQVWRNQLILEYEIPKYEGDLGQPNVFVPIDEADRSRKCDHLLQYFGSQRSKDWFRAETFDALLRLRGIECRAPSGYAEAFHARKLVW